MTSSRKDENSDSVHFKRLSLFNETAENQSSYLKLKTKKFNYTEVTRPKERLNKKRNSRFKIEQSLAKNSTFEKISKKKNSLSVSKILIKQKYISSHKSPRINNNPSLKHLEKDIQQKIIDISMKLEQESSLTNGDNKFNLSYFIKRKLGQESEMETSSNLSRIKKNIKNYRNISFTGKKLLMSSLSDGPKNNNKSCCFPISKIRKI